MFTWICPQCGREVPPSYTDCPDCARKAAEPQPDLSAAPAPPPPHAAPPVQPPYQQPQYAPPPPRGGLPTWLMAILFAVGIVGLVAGVLWLVRSPSSGVGARPSAAVESPAAKAGAKTNPYQKYIEISGVRFVENAKKKIEVRFVLTNHSNADIPGLGGNVTLWGRTRTSEEDATGSFTFSTDLKGYEAKDMSVPLATKHKIYELPDWQNVTTDVQITKPE